MSTAGGWEVGQPVRGGLAVQTVETVDPPVQQHVDGINGSLSGFLGALGRFTARVGVRKIGHSQPGETLVVSAAAGAVWSLAGQIAQMDSTGCARSWLTNPQTACGSIGSASQTCTCGGSP